MQQYDSRRGSNGQRGPDVIIGDVLWIKRENPLLQGLVERQRTQNIAALDFALTGGLDSFAGFRCTANHSYRCARRKYSSECGGERSGAVIDNRCSSWR